MADSMTDNPETVLFQQEKFLDSFPTEILVKFIFKHSSLASLMQLSATCRHFRFLVHDIFTSRLSGQAANYPEIRKGLARLGWSKDHELWTCNCFKIVGGPAVTWGQLEQKKRFSGVCNQFNEHLYYPKISTTVAGKTFLIVSDDNIIYWENTSDRATEADSPQTLISFNSARISHLSSYDNVMAFSVKRDVGRCISVYNPSSLTKVTDIDLLATGSHSGGEEIRAAVVQTITFAKNTMLVHLFYATVNIPFETNIQLWKIDTKNPREEEMSFISSISHRNAPISRLLFNRRFQVDFNDRYVVVLEERLVKVLSRNKEPELICQFGFDGRYRFDIPLLKIRGDLIALAFRSYNDDNVPEIMVKVYSVRRGVLILQKDLNEGPCPELRYMEWFGPHLVIVLQKGNALTMMSWQEGLESFMTCPVSVPEGLRRSPRGHGGSASNWDLQCINVDYRSITSAHEKNRQNGWYSHPLTYFQTWDSN